MREKTVFLLITIFRFVVIVRVASLMIKFLLYICIFLTNTLSVYTSFIHLPFAKLLHISSNRRIIFCSTVVEVLPCSGCFITSMGAHFPQLSWIGQSSLARFPGCQGFCGIVPNGPAGSVFPSKYVRDWSVSM